MRRLKLESIAARLGLGVTLVGFVVMFIGWNGAASTNSVAGQIPYLISGGLVGLGLVIVGAALIIVETSRDDREELRKAILELSAAQEPEPTKPPAEAPAGRGQFLAGARSFHRPGCRLLEGREAQIERVTLETAANRRLSPCRVCEPIATQRRS